MWNVVGNNFDLLGVKFMLSCLMFYTTNQYDLAVGDKGQIPRVLKRLLYNIPQVRQAVPQLAAEENQPGLNETFDETTQAAVEFFQKWKNLKLRDGRVNHETWIALGQFTSAHDIELKNLHEPVLKLLLTNTTTVSNRGATLWPSKYTYYIHQESVKRVLKKALSAKDLERVMFAVWDADRDDWQTVEFSYRHAMTPTGMSKEDARAKANEFVRSEISLAQGLMNQNNSHDAMLHLGYAIHCLQDATSPAHAGFRVYEGGHIELGEHVYEELFDPGAGSWLDEATARGYKYFQNQLGCPADYFADLGNDVFVKK